MKRKIDMIISSCGECPYGNVDSCWCRLYETYLNESSFEDCELPEGK